MRTGLVALLLGLLTFSGCGERQETPEERAAAIVRIEAARKEVGRSMNELAARVKAKLKTDDPGAIQREIEKTSEWKRLTLELRRLSDELASRRSK